MKHRGSWIFILSALVLAGGLPRWSDIAEGDSARVHAPLWVHGLAIACVALLCIAAVITVLGAALMFSL